MDNIGKEQHRELVNILNQLIKVIMTMRQDNGNYILFQIEREARDWLKFLEEHTDKDELKSLENEICDQFFFKFNVGGVGDDEINIRRLELIERYILKSNEYLKK